MQEQVWLRIGEVVGVARAGCGTMVAVPSPRKPEPLPQADPAGRWQVSRQDDNGQVVEVGRYATHQLAEQVVQLLEARGHRQLYRARRLP